MVRESEQAEDDIVFLSRIGDAPLSALFPEEAALVSHAAPSRQREFATGRALAREALSRLGSYREPILMDSHRAPLWPRGVTGSITHSSAYRAVALGRSECVASIGIDAETPAPIPDRVIAAVASPVERRRLERFDAHHPGIPGSTLLFCAKEAIIKAWYPRVGSPLPFLECEITLDHDSRAFTGTIRSNPAALPDLRSIRGRWFMDRDHVVTCAVTGRRMAAPGASR